MIRMISGCGGKFLGWAAGRYLLVSEKFIVYSVAGHHLQRTV